MTESKNKKLVLKLKNGEYCFALVKSETKVQASRDKNVSFNIKIQLNHADQRHGTIKRHKEYININFSSKSLTSNTCGSVHLTQK